ncbi:hypothetical protein FS837_012307, partial [Tulasnella sp. UAMH 9824]
MVSPQVLTGDFPFDGVKRENEVVTRIIGGNIPNIAEYFDSPQSVVATSADGEITPVEEEPTLSLDVIQTIEQPQLVEGGSGKGIQDLLRLRTSAQRTGEYYEFIDCQTRLDNYKRSAHGIETEAEKQLLHAAFHYVQAGFWTQVSECEQFLEGLQEVMRSPRPPVRIPLLGSPELFYLRERPGPRPPPSPRKRYRQLVPNISHAIYSQEYGLKDLAWFVAGALEVSPFYLTEEKIFSLIKTYQPWRIAHELDAGRDEAFVVKYPPL